MQIIDRIVHYSGVTVLGFVTLVAMLSAIVIVTQWSGVREFLLGA